MSKLALGSGKFAATQLEEISELMAAQLSEQNERVSEMVWSSKCLLEAGFIISALSFPIVRSVSIYR